MASTLLLLSCEQQKALDNPPEATDIATITAISAERAAAFNAGDAEGIAVHFSDEAFLIAPGTKTLQGLEAVQQYYQAIFDVYETELESGYESVKVDGDLAYGRGFATVTLKPKAGGKKIISTSKYLNILERQTDGSWKTTHDIWNDNQETPGTSVPQLLP